MRSAQLLLNPLPVSRAWEKNWATALKRLAPTMRPWSWHVLLSQNVSVQQCSTKGPMVQFPVFSVHFTMPLFCLTFTLSLNYLILFLVYAIKNRFFAHHSKGNHPLKTQSPTQPRRHHCCLVLVRKLQCDVFSSRDWEPCLCVMVLAVLVGHVESILAPDSARIRQEGFTLN